jgi:hypothetical protein
VKRQHKIFRRIAFGLLVVGFGDRLLADQAEADVSARRFLCRLRAGDYERARHLLNHVNPASVEFLELWCAPRFGL